jgi:hypothetical protein
VPILRQAHFIQGGAAMTELWVVMSIAFVLIAALAVALSMLSASVKELAQLVRKLLEGSE